MAYVGGKSKGATHIIDTLNKKKFDSMKYLEPTNPMLMKKMTGGRQIPIYLYIMTHKPRVQNHF